MKPRFYKLLNNNILKLKLIPKSIKNSKLKLQNNDKLILDKKVIHITLPNTELYKMVNGQWYRLTLDKKNWFKVNFDKKTGYFNWKQPDGKIVISKKNLYNEYEKLNKNKDINHFNKESNNFEDSLNHKTNNFYENLKYPFKIESKYNPVDLINRDNFYSLNNIQIDYNKKYKGCAQAVTNFYENNSKFGSKQNGVFGDAWNMIYNIYNKGGELKYNIYDNTFNDISNLDELIKLTYEKLKSNPINYNKIKIGDIVGIFVPNSNSIDLAINYGTTKNTHVGYVTGYDKDGIPLVTHYINDLVKTQRANDLHGDNSRIYITSVVSPKNKFKINSLKLVPKSNNILINHNIGTDFNKVLDGMESVKNTFSKLFPNIDINQAMYNTIAIQKVETNFGINRESDILNSDDFISKSKIRLKHTIRNLLNVSPENISSNQMKMKFNSLTKDERNLLGINNPKDLENPYLAGIASFYLICRNTDYFNRYSKSNPDLNLTDSDIQNAAILSYNQGMTKLKHLGFDKNNNYKGLTAFRNLSNPNIKIKDVSSTNYKYFNNIYNGLGDYLFNIEYPEGYDSYINRVNLAKTLIKIPTS